MNTERLRTSPTFVLASTMDGRPYVAKETEPYVQYWLSERERVLHGLFATRGGLSTDAAVNGYFRITATPRTAGARAHLRRTISGMRDAGVLIATRQDTSRYDSRIVREYVEHRPFPRAIADHIAARGALTAESRVLDLAGGPGDLALALARTTPHVSMIELSRAFVATARRRARALDLPLDVIHDTCNRLVHRDDQFDIVTCSQALHWLDDVQVARGVCRVLGRNGSFFVIQSSIEVPDAHPMAPALGRHSVLGHKTTATFAEDVEPLMKRLTLLFEALDAPDVHRHDPTQRWRADAGARIAPASVSLFRQERPFDLGYVRGFVTDEHIRPTGLTPAAFWGSLESRAASVDAAAFAGIHHWAVLQFQRGGTAAPLAPVASLPARDIPFTR